MSSFTRRLRYENTDVIGEWGLRVYRLTEPFTYYVGQKCSSMRIDVPAGFETDLASVPTFARLLFSPDGPWAQPAVLHDWLYREAAVPRSICDLIMFESMLLPPQVGPAVPRWHARTIYHATRIGGGSTYAVHLARRRAAAARDLGGTPAEPSSRPIRAGL